MGPGQSPITVKCIDLVPTRKGTFRQLSHLKTALRQSEKKAVVQALIGILGLSRVEELGWALQIQLEARLRHPAGQILIPLYPVDPSHRGTSESIAFSHPADILHDPFPQFLRGEHLTVIAELQSEESHPLQGRGDTHLHSLVIERGHDSLAPKGIQYVARTGSRHLQHYTNGFSSKHEMMFLSVERRIEALSVAVARQTRDGMGLLVQDLHLCHPVDSIVGEVAAAVIATNQVVLAIGANHGKGVNDIEAFSLGYQYSFDVNGVQDETELPSILDGLLNTFQVLEESPVPMMGPERQRMDMT